MADKRDLIMVNGEGNLPTYVPHILKDNGDGTYTPTVYVVNSSTQTQPANATVYTKTTTASVTTVLDANANRKGATFFSVSGTILIKLGTGASSTSFTARLVTNGYYELPYPAYTGAVTAIGAGTLNVTETF